jgi:hypothetical protein
VIIRLSIPIFVAFTWVTPSHAAPPPPPEGYRWVPNPSFTDEFNGDTLDTSKWFDYNPKWKGRPPAKFIPSAISLKDGFLHIRNSMLPVPDGEYTIACGAVTSRAPAAFYGYYEARMKASNSPMSSTFWLTNRATKVGNLNVSHELDIVEAVGITTATLESLKNWGKYMHSNTHIKASEASKSITTPKQVLVEPPVSKAFHTYGAWWVDAKTIHVYLDDKHVYTMHPSTSYSATPFDRPMQMNMVTETYDWQIPPTPGSLKDPANNTTYYDWVRSYTLKMNTSPASQPAAEEPRTGHSKARS